MRTPLPSPNFKEAPLKHVDRTCLARGLGKHVVLESCQVRFQLDKRLAEAAQNAGAKELQMQRTELFQAKPSPCVEGVLAWRPLEKFV